MKEKQNSISNSYANDAQNVKRKMTTDTYKNNSLLR